MPPSVIRTALAESPFRISRLNWSPLVSLMALLQGSAIAWAHSGLPESTNVLFQSPETELPLVSTTFGLLSPAGAGSWRWTCPEVMSGDELLVAGLGVDGTRYMGGYFSLWRSPDGCSWNIVPELQGLLITQIDRDTLDSNRLWVSTATANTYNALWCSDDSGASFAPCAYFGESSRVSGFAQGPEGVPWFAAGWWNDLPHVMYSETGAAWQIFRLDEYSDYGIDVLALDPLDETQVYVQLDGDEVDFLARFGTDGALEILLEIPDQIFAFSIGFEPNELIVGGAYTGVYTSQDGGQTWSDPDLTYEANCYVTQGTRRFQCVNNYISSASVLIVHADSDLVEKSAYFGDVHGVESCPAETETALICEPLWESYKYSIGMDLVPVEEEPTPVESSPSPVEPDSSGCSCSITGPPPPRPIAAIGWLLSFLLLSRRRSQLYVTSSG